MVGVGPPARALVASGTLTSTRNVLARLRTFADSVRAAPRTRVERSWLDVSLLLEESDRLLSFSPTRLRTFSEAGESVAPSSLDALVRANAGHCVQLEHAERCSPIVGDCAVSLRATNDLRRVRANLYLNPPGGGGSTAPHRDYGSVIAVQVAGRRRWRVWDQDLLECATAPTTRMRATLHADPDVDDVPPAVDTILEPGDVIFVRGGDPHAVETVGDADSVHITFMSTAPSFVDLAYAMVDQLTDDPALRRPLTSSDDVHAATIEILDAMRSLGEHDPNDLSERLIEREVSSWFPGGGPVRVVHGDGSAATVALGPVPFVTRCSDALLAGGLCIDVSPAVMNVLDDARRAWPDSVDATHVDPDELTRAIALGLLRRVDGSTPREAEREGSRRV